jgi:hypothetical protein
VEFRVGNELKCTSTAAPFQCNWDTTGLPSGQDYLIKVLAYNFDGDNREKTVKVWIKEIPLQCVTAKNTDHVSAGRAEECEILYTAKACAVGSGDDLGQLGSEHWSPMSSVQETYPGHWIKVDSCP